MENAGMGVTQVQKKNLFRWRGKGVGQIRKGFLQFPPRPRKRVTPRAGEECPFKKRRGEGASWLKVSALKLRFSLMGTAVLIEEQRATSVYPNLGPGVRKGRTGRERDFIVIDYQK